MNLTKKQKQEIRKLSLFNDFIFAKIMSNKDNCKHLLELILEKKISYIETVDYQKTIKSLIDAKGVRLDVYVKDDEEKSYDIEVQVAHEKNIAKRARYYGSMIDNDLLYVGDDYSELSESFIIFICPFDILGKGEYKYVFRTACLEIGDALDDGLTKIFINTKAKDKCENKELREFLSYMEDKSIILESDYMKKIDEELVMVLEDTEKGKGEEKMFVSLQEHFNRLDLEREKKEVEEDLTKKREELKETSKELKEKSEELKETSKELKEKSEELKEKSEELKKKDETILNNILGTIDILKNIGLSKSDIKDKIEETFDINEEVLKKLIDK
jgi:conserved hypothetical protein (putative transposase or invertase)